MVVMVAMFFNNNAELFLLMTDKVILDLHLHYLDSAVQLANIFRVIFVCFAFTISPNSY